MGEDKDGAFECHQSHKQHTRHSTIPHFRTREADKNERERAQLEYEPLAEAQEPQRQFNEDTACEDHGAG